MPHFAAAAATLVILVYSLAHVVLYISIVMMKNEIEKKTNYVLTL